MDRSARTRPLSAVVSAAVSAEVRRIWGRVRRPRPARDAQHRRFVWDALEARVMLAGDGLNATYYDHIDFSGGTATRLDAKLDFLLPDGTPPVAGIAANTFTAQWTGRLDA